MTLTSDYKPEYAVDGIWTTTESRWTSDNRGSLGFGPPHWLEIDLKGSFVLTHATVWTGALGDPGSAETVAKAAIQNFKLQYKSGPGDWTDIPGGAVESNPTSNAKVELAFSSLVTADKVRFYTEDDDYARVREILVYGDPSN